MTKSNWFKYLLLVSVVTAFVSAISLFIFSPPGTVNSKKLMLKPPFKHVGGFTYVASAPTWITSDDIQWPTASHLILLENNSELGPAHALHSVIGTKGKGSYSHWEGLIYFSASDNTDPNLNKRHYLIIYPTKLHYALYFIALLLIFLLVSFVLSGFLSNFWRKSSLTYVIAIILLNIIATFALIQGSFWILLKDRLTSSPKLVLDWYDLIFEKKLPSQEFAKYFSGSISYFKEHHSLNYALNPDAAYAGIKQFNGDYLIRRTEKIRPVNQVHWRALVLGGSTTFGEMVPNEKDTWVYLVEKRLRQSYGPGIDIINGGVGGYSIAENQIHYTQLLTNLSPDLVILYVGINDIGPRLVGSIKPDYSNYWIPWRAKGSNLPQSSVLLSYFYAYRYYYLAQYIEKYRSRHILGEAAKPLPNQEDWESALEQNSSKYYRGYLENLVLLILSQGRKVVILPQYYNPRSERNKIFSKGVIEHNKINEELSQKYHLSFLRALVNETTFQEEDLFDACHFNEKGDIKMAHLVSDFLEQHNLINKVNPVSGSQP